MKIGIFIYPEAEVLDFAGPFEVLSTAKRVGDKPWQVFLIAKDKNAVKVRGGMQVLPDYSIHNHPEMDILILVGGDHTNAYKDLATLTWIQEQSTKVNQITSVCTGVFFLAESGILNGARVTTHWEDIAELKESYPELDVVGDVRWVEHSPFVTSGGISAGIDMSLFLVSKLADKSLAEKTARQMEYPCPPL
ncbi:DJ-1/PfpI family protein [Vibrio sonorensis]|uniref:DJ-1/PfpI family protein n=1 Tax=Vibrio sonorensis TaxID=1004316 RepID=UPI0008D92093|nr:DJ-1/PfpI family protein [Vibrio sonorensis]